jgi:hypothetical protein
MEAERGAMKMWKAAATHHQACRRGLQAARVLRQWSCQQANIQETLSETAVKERRSEISGVGINDVRGRIDAELDDSADHVPHPEGQYVHDVVNVPPTVRACRSGS